MEELKILIEMVSALPKMAIWVLIGFFVYKVVIVGSIFGVTRLAILKGHDWAKSRIEAPKIRKVEIYGELDRLTITGNLKFLIRQLDRIAGISSKSGSDFIHASDIRWLASAIDEKLDRDKDKGK